MSDHQKMDAFIKAEFSNYAPEVSPHIWENILAERAKRKPKGFWFNFFNTRNILLLGGLLIIATGSAVYFNQGTSIAQISHNTSNTNLSNNTIPASAKGSTPNNEFTSSTTVSKPVSSEKENVNADPKTTSSVNTDPSGTTAPVTVSAVSSGSSTKKNTILGSDNVMSGNNIHTRSLIKKKTRFNTHIKTNTQEAVAVPADEKPFAPEGSNEEQALHDSQEIVGGTLLGKLLFGAQNITETLQDKPSVFSTEMKDIKLPGCPTIEKENRSRQYVEAYAGPDLIFRSFSDTPNSTYLIRRKESTKLVNAYSAGIRYTKVYKNGLSLRAGINFSQINEKFTYVLSNLTQVTYTTDPVTGDTTGTFIYRASSKKNTYNHYRSIDLPVLIGYELDNGRWQLNFNAGAIVNIYSWQKGELIGTDNRPVVITTGKGSSPYQYKTNIGLGLTAAISAYYQVTDKVHILFEPNYRYNLSPINKNNISLKQKYNSIGLRVGVRVDLK